MMNIFPAGSAGLRSKTDDVMRNLFGRTQNDPQTSGSPTVLTGPRVPRHSSAWKDLLKFLKARAGLAHSGYWAPPLLRTSIFLPRLAMECTWQDVVNEALHATG